METNEVIARIIVLVNQEPRYFRELVRIFREENGYSFNYWVEKVGEALAILILENKVQKVSIGFEPLFTSTVWTPYSIYTPVKEPPIGWEKYNKIAQKKMKRLEKISSIGLKNAEMYEKLVYEVAKSLLPDAVRSPFKSPLPDIYSPSENLIIEATTRFEYPITRNYLLWKYYHLGVPFEGQMKTNEYFDEAYFRKDKPLKMLVIAPIVGKSAWKTVEEQTDPHKGIPQAIRSGIPVIKVIQFPKTDQAHAGWPLFKTFSYYAKWLEEYHRKVYLLDYREAKKRLKVAISNALRNWKEQEQVLISSKTYND